MTEAELAPRSATASTTRSGPTRLYNHDAEDPDNLADLGQTDQGEDVEINKRAAECDLLVYVNINLVAMDGGRKSVAARPRVSTAALRHHHNVDTMQHSQSFMDQHEGHSAINDSSTRMGKVLGDAAA